MFSSTSSRSLKSYAFVFFVFCSHLSFAQQQEDTSIVDLDEVVIKAYEQGRRLRDIPAAVNYIGPQTLSRFGAVSIVQAINTTPGVRMEERSPGSYRLNIRGSALRSPFGVRNVKVYYNDLPFTHPGGQTYFNNFGNYNFSSIEIIKGPGSSLYGAGTGGVVLAEHLANSERPGALIEYTAGSFGLHNIYGSVITGTEKFRSKIGFQHQESGGYRVQSALQRDVLTWTGDFNVDDKRNLKTTFVYSDLFYKTPGALTAAEYRANPKAARPGNAAFPGAEAAQASINQKTFLAGASYTQQLLSNLQNKTVLYGSYTQLLNPAIQNYGRVSEPHFGGRTTFNFKESFSRATLTMNGGGEWQQGFTKASIHKNRNGVPDTVQQYYEVANRQSLLFAQASLDVQGWTLTAGASFNNLNIKYNPFFPVPVREQARKFKNILAPRFALMKTLENITVYTSVAKGFSPPTTEEFFPSGNAPNINLAAEDGTNYDLGLRGNFGGLNVDINAFNFKLSNSIVQRRTAGGGFQYLNAGNTAQKGIETNVTYPLLQKTPFIERGNLWISHTYHRFNYRDFTKDTVDLSNKKIPGIPPHTLSTGIDLLAANGLLATVSYLFTDRTPLTDANNSYADSYSLLGARIGFQKSFGEKWNLKIIVGADNLLNEKYSLGNDVNGFGGRYFNAAPARNYFTSLMMQRFK